MVIPRPLKVLLIETTKVKHNGGEDDIKRTTYDGFAAGGFREMKEEPYLESKDLIGSRLLKKTPRCCEGERRKG